MSEPREARPPQPARPVRLLMRAWVMGTCVGVAVAFPAIVVAQILDAVLDDGLPAVVTVLVVAVVLAAPVIGAFAAGRQDPRGLIGIAIGSTCLFLIAGFGALRRGVAGDEVEAWTVPALTVIGGLLGSFGALASQAGRTRR